MTTRTWIDPVEDGRESELWLMNADGTRKRRLVDGSSAVWSADGTRIAYLAEGDPKGTQIWVRWMDAEGAASQVTRVTDSPSDIAWSPDGTMIAFRARVGGDEAWSIPLPKRPEGAEWTESPRIVERAVYRRDRRGFIDDGHQHLFVVPADGGPVRQVSEGDYDFGAPTWSPDGSTLYFSGLLVEDAEHVWRESEVYALDVDSGAVTQLTTREGPDYGPVVSPDGSKIAFSGYDFVEQTYIERQLYVMGADGSEARSVTPELDRSPSGWTWSADSSGLYFNVRREGTSNLWFVPADGSEPPAQVTDGEHMLSVSDLSDDGTAVATVESSHEPGDIYAFDVDAPGEMRRRTRVNVNLLDGIELGAVEEIWYDSADGLEIQGWVIKPPDFDPSVQYPLTLAIHGGPHGMYDVGFNFGWQEHAANGYVVLYTNPRGSSGYGTEFGNAINRAYPDKDFDDLMAGVDTVIAEGYIDERNMYVYGCSGGGVLTAWVVGHTDRFAAMIRFNDEWHGTSSKPSNFLRTQLYLRHWFERYMTEDAVPKQLERARREATETTAGRE